MKFISFFILLFLNFSLQAQYDDEMFGEEEMKQLSEIIKIGKNGQFTLKIHNKEGGTYHYNLVDNNNNNNEIFPDVINSVDSSSNGNYILQLDERCLILDKSLKVIKSYENEFTKIEKLNFYLSKSDQLYIFDEIKFFVPLYEILGINPKITKSLNINLNGSNNQSDFYNLIYSPNFDDVTNNERKQFILNLKLKKLSKKHYEQIEFHGDTIFAFTNFQKKSVEILNKNLELIDSYPNFYKYKDFLFDHTQFILAKQNNQKWVLLSKELKKITDQEFDTIYAISLATIKLNSGYHKEIQYEDKVRFDKNFHYVAKLNEKWMYLDKNGKIIFETNQHFTPLENNIFMIRDQAGKYNYLNLAGKNVFPFNADSIYLFNSNIFLKHEGNWQLYSTKKQKLIYEKIENFQALNWGLFAFSSGKKWALANGNNFPEKLNYEYDSFKHGAYKQLIVEKNKKWGILNLRFEENALIYPIIHDQISVYHNIVYEIHQKGKIELFANTEGSNKKKYDKVFFTLISDDFGYPFVMHCYIGKTKELVKFKNENLFGM